MDMLRSLGRTTQAKIVEQEIERQRPERPD